MLIDLHAHSHLSKGCALNPRAVLDKAQSFGLDAVAFTETNTQDGCDELMALRHPVKVFVGLELNTDKGQYLCFFPRPEQVPDPVQLWGSNRDKAWSAAEALPKVKQLGAAVIAARPYDRDFSHPAMDHVLSLQAVLSGIESFNPRLRPSANDLAAEAAEKLRLPGAGGSDARGSLDEVGRGATLFKREIEDQADLVRAILEGHFWPVPMGELPRLIRPGEGREANKRSGGKRRRGRGGRPDHRR